MRFWAAGSGLSTGINAMSAIRNIDCGTMFRLFPEHGQLSRTGSLIALFLFIHLRSFFWPVRMEGGHVSEYMLVCRAFSDPIYDGFYLTAFFLLGMHLKHGFRSAFQTLGLRNKKYTPIIDAAAFIVWFLIPIGYASIPVYFYFTQIGGR